MLSMVCPSFVGVPSAMHASPVLLVCPSLVGLPSAQCPRVRTARPRYRHHARTPLPSALCGGRGEDAVPEHLGECVHDVADTA